MTINQNFINKLIQELKTLGENAITMRGKGLEANIKTTKEDIVTNTDKYLSNSIQRYIKDNITNINIVDEETSKDYLTIDYGALSVVIDPIDGTSTYFNGGNDWGISVGFVEENKPLAGILHFPELGKTLYAFKGEGAYENNKRIYTSELINFSKSNCTWTDAYQSDLKEYKRTRRVWAKLEEREIRNYTPGSQVAAIRDVAIGNADFFWHLKTKPWDVTAGIIIVEEAGGMALNIKGEPYNYFDEEIIISNGHIDLTQFYGSIAEVY